MGLDGDRASFLDAPEALPLPVGAVGLGDDERDASAVRQVAVGSIDDGAVWYVDDGRSPHSYENFGILRLHFHFPSLC